MPCYESPNGWRQGSVLLLLDKRGIRSSKIELLPAVFKPTGTA